MSIQEERKKLVGWLILFFLSTSPFAASGHIYLGGTIGASMVKIGNSNPIIHYYNHQLTDAYPVQGKYATTPVIGINGGYEFAGAGLTPAIAIGLGMYDTPIDDSYRGQLIETAIGDPSSTLYHYIYNVSSTRLMLEAQCRWILLGKFVPFINVGMGPAWNRLNGYTESPVDNTGYVALPPFQSRSHTYFAYQAGLGVGYAFNLGHCTSGYLHERISLGYQYVDLGNASFGTRGVVYPYRLDVGRLTNHEIYLTYTHLL